MYVSYNNSIPQQLFLERPHLLEKLKLSIQHKLTLIIAPPGYGKTTLVTQFASSINMPVAWQMLERQDQDLPNLVEHCLKSLSQVAPEIGNTTRAAGTTAAELATTVTDYLRHNVTDDFLYIIDDVHYLLGSQNAKLWMKTFIATLPPTCHLILVGQTFPPLSIRELIARGELISIGQENLSFSLEEVGKLAEKVGSKLPNEQINQLFWRLLGWPAGTILALQPLPLAIEDTLFEGKEAPEALFGALADRLFRSQSLGLQTFLLSSSTLLRMTPALCQDALNLTHSLAYINEALQHNLFMTETAGGLAYHSLFRDFLQHKLLDQDPIQFAKLHGEAARWFEAENQFEEAFGHYIIAEDWEQAANLAEETAHIYMREGKLETLLGWETALNNAKIYAPRFFHFCAIIHRDRYAYDLAIADADRAEAGFHAKGNAVGLIQIALLRATIDNQQGHFLTALNRAELFSRDQSIPSNLKGFALSIVGMAALNLRKFDDALAFLQSALPLYRATDDLFAVAHLLMTLEVVYLRLGRFPDAAQCVQEAITIRREFGDTVGIVMALNNLGYHYHLLGDYDQAQEILREGVQVANRIPENRAEGHLLWTMGDLKRDLGLFDEAILLYQHSLQIVDDNEPFLKASVLVSYATLKRWQGKWDEANDFALEAYGIAENHYLGWEQLLATCVLYAIQIERGDFALIIHELDTVVTEWTRHPSPQIVQTLGLCAYAALLSSEEVAAHRYLKLAVTNANHLANLQPLIAEIIYNPLLKKFIEHNKGRYEVLYRGLQSLEEAQDKVRIVQEPYDATNSITYTLRVSVLGREIIERDTKKVSLSDWQAVSARELFFYLLFRGASTREEIALALWPDSSAQQIRGKFHATLHRVRDAVGTNSIVFENELYSINPKIDLWCDVDKFKTLIKQAQMSSHLIPHTELLWRQAIRLFQGDFLSAFDAVWVVTYRELLTNMYLDALVALANCVRLRGNLQESISLLKCALEVDPLRENIHRLLLKDYKTLGDRSLIVRHVQQLNNLFWSELGVRPSPETIALSQTLLG